MAANSHLATAPLPAGWSKHISPTGHTYFYNAETKVSTYRRPTVSSSIPLPPVQLNHEQLPTPYLQLSDPRVANRFIAQQSRNSEATTHTQPNASRHHGQKPRHTPADKPQSRTPIPGCEPWVLVYTKYGRRFAYNPDKNTSYWRIPDKLKPAILELDRARILNATENKTKATTNDQHHDSKTSEPENRAGEIADPSVSQISEDSDTAGSENGDFEAADDDDGSVDGEHQAKRFKAVPYDDELEFGEDDIAFQLQSTGEDGDSYWLQDADQLEDSGAVEEDKPHLFMELLEDFKISPYSSWDKILEDGKIIDDPRYTVLTTMKSRKAVWEDWSRSKIKELKEKKAGERKPDPLSPYVALLQQHATPKLYWAEFKRKYRKEPAMRDLTLPEKEKERLFREYVARIKLPQATLKSDLIKLLQSVPLSDWEGSVPPKRVSADIRFLALDAKIRDPLVDAYVKAEASK